MRLVQVVGARPQFVKLGPVSRAIAARNRAGAAIDEVVIHTGQHYDPQMSDVFFAELDLPRPAVNLEIGSGPHGQQTGRMLERIEAELVAHRPDAVVIYGDTNSTLAAAVAAAKLRIPVAHVEAGLRSWNRDMPEEQNRVVADHLCDLLFAPTEAAVDNLAREGLAARTRLVGDVMYDAVMANVLLARQRSRILEAEGLLPGAFAVVTIHRAESTSDDKLPLVLELLGGAAGLGLQLVFPIHPRTRAALSRVLPSWRPPAGLRLIDPVGPLDMLRLVEASAGVVTDSGGVQKEAFILGRPCVTVRSETEWIETVTDGANTVVGLDPARALAAMRGFAATDHAALARRAAARYGEGRAAERIVAEVEGLVRGAVPKPG